MIKTRKSGVLMHITSLPSPFGIGVMGPSAKKFAEKIKSMGFSIWLVLPLNPPDRFASPYASESAFAGNFMPLMEVKSEFGFEDAMQTGIFTGVYNGFVYSVVGVIHHNSKIRDMDIKLQPVFGKICFYNRFSCILHIKTVHIIVIAFSVLKILRKVKKEGR